MKNKNNNKNKINFLMLFALAILAFFTPLSAYASDPLTDALNSILKADATLNNSHAAGHVEYFNLWLRYLFGSFIFKPWTGSEGDVTALS